MKLRTLLANLVVIILTGVVITAVSAQELCETLVRDAWEVVSENCEGAGGDSACYGNDSLNATFNTESPTTSFASPGDQNSLQDLHTIRTAPFNEADEEWGISDFLIPAESFGGTPDQTILIFTAGDVIVENAVEPGSEDQMPMQSFNFTTGGSSECREAPNAVFIQSPQGLEVDLSVNSTPFRLGSTIVISTEVDEATGHDVMVFGVLEGSLTLYPDTPDEQVVPAGGFTTALLSDEQGYGLENEAVITSGLVPVLDRITGEPILGIDDEPFYRQIPVTDFTEPQAITLNGAGYAGWGAYQFVNLIPVKLLIYPVNIPDLAALADNAAPSSAKPKPTTTAPTVVNNWCSPGGKWDDGRCNNADPFISDWHWTAGWYHAAFENGLIDEIPDQYKTPPITEATSTSSGPTQVPPTATLPPGVTPSNTPTNTPSLTPSLTPTNTLTFTPTFTLTWTPSLTPSLTFTPSLTPLPPFDAQVTGCTDLGNGTYDIDITASNIPLNTDTIYIYDSVAYTINYWGGEEPYNFTTNRAAAELPLTLLEPHDINDVPIVSDGTLGAMPPCSN